MKIAQQKVLVRAKDFQPSSSVFEVIGALNPGVERLPNGDIVMYVRIIERLKKSQDKTYCYAPRLVGNKTYKIVIDKFKKTDLNDFTDLDMLFKDDTKRLSFISHLRRVVLDKDGFTIKSIDKKPSFFGVAHDGELGIEDPRITKIGNMYYMTYVSLSRQGNISTSYAVSKDGLKWERKGIAFKEQNKDVVLFPEKIRGRFYALDRPEGNFEFTPPHMWMSSSKDGEYWGKPRPLQIARRNHWDYARVGAGCPPLNTHKGWLEIYHGVIEPKRQMSEELVNMLRKLFRKKVIAPKARTKYCAGALIFSHKFPRKLLQKSPRPILLPKMKEEKGTFEKKDVLFPTGLIYDENPEYVLMYAGGGDRVTTVRKIKLSEILKRTKSVRF